MIRPDYKEFARWLAKSTLVPVAKSISADLLTPVSAFLAVAAREPYAFLLESVEGGEKIGRFTRSSACDLFLRLESRGDQVTIHRDSAASRQRRDTRGGKKSFLIPKIETRTASVFEVIKELLHQHKPAQVEGLPPFTAGAVGYCAYDIVRQLENISSRTRAHAEDDLDVPDCILMFFDRVLAFDHLRHQIDIVASADVSANRLAPPTTAPSAISRESSASWPAVGSPRTGPRPPLSQSWLSGLARPKRSFSRAFAAPRNTSPPETSSRSCSRSAGTSSLMSSPSISTAPCAP